MAANEQDGAQREDDSEREGNIVMGRRVAVRVGGERASLGR